MKQILFLISVLFMFSCTKTGAGYRPVVMGSENSNFENDLKYCQTLAKHYKDFGYDSAVELGGSAALGAGLGQMFDSTTGSTLIGAGIGLGAAAVKKILHHNNDRKDIIKSCLSYKGYRVLK